MVAIGRAPMSNPSVLLCDEIRAWPGADVIARSRRAPAICAEG
jgi:hypothetical protein